MPEPIPVPDSARQNSPNRRNFMDEIRNQGNRLDKIERGSIRSGSVGGEGIEFYDLETGLPTSKVGEFSTTRWDQDLAQWFPVENARGVSISEASSPPPDPWWIAASDGAKQFFIVGMSDTEVESIIMSAKDMWFICNSDDDNNRSSLHFSDSGNVEIDLDGSGEFIVFDLGGSSGGVPLVSDNGLIKTSTSALKYKQDVEDAVVDPEDVLNMQPRTWRDRSDVAKNSQTDRRFVGFIADELADQPSLRQFVVFNDDDEPEAIYYDRLSVALLELAKHQQAQLDDHQRQINDLNEKIDQLKNMVESLS